MKDELEEIKQILRQTPKVKASPAAKKAAITQALAAFDKNNLKVTQGMSVPKRLKVTASAVGHFIFGRTQMKKHQVWLTGAFCALFVIWLNGSISPDSKSVYDEQPKMEPEKAAGSAIPSAVVMPSGTDTATGKDTRVAEAKKEMVESLTLGKQAANVGQLADNENIPAASVAAPVPVLAESARTEAETLARGASMPMQATKAKILPSPAVMEPKPDSFHEQGRDKFSSINSNPLKLTKDEPVSTFSIDVDTASYSFVRSSLNQNQLPQKNAVRVEEMINYFPYDYSPASNRDEPFKANVSVFPTPWNKDTKLLHIGIKGYQLDAKAKPKANLVFLIDTSGSMNEPNKLPLVQNALKLLLDSLSPEDSVAIVTYAGNAGVALAPTKVSEKSRITAIIDNLGAAGSTAGAEGIRQAYQLAEQNLDPKGINRVILATDGDFNVGITDQNELKSFIERKRANGVTLSVLGFGSGNYNDALMQTLAQNGNGNAAYIDTLNEARKALVEEAASTLFTIARDVKIQVEFNPAKVAEYRLIGYETRLLKTEDFNNDKVDAGDIGSGHTVTALYEITPVSSNAKLVDELRYQSAAKPDANSKSDEYAFVKIRYKLPDGDNSKLITTPVGAGQEYQTLADVPVEPRFAMAVAAFGELLRGDAYLKNFGYDDVVSLAQNARGADSFGYRAEFINLVRLAKNAPALPVLGQ